MGSQGDSRLFGSSGPPSSSGKMGNFSLARQTSIYSLTLEEFQNTMGGPGKNFGSMNMDEFLKNIWTAEESQAMATALGAGENNLQRQGSLTIPRTLSRKTVDEVWRDIQKDSSGAQSNGMDSNNDRQITYGEMTLEDFLVKAGVVREENMINNNSNSQQGNSQFGGFNVNPIGRMEDGSVAAGNGLALDLSNGEMKSTTNVSPSLPMPLPMSSSAAALVSDAMFKASQPQADWFGNAHRSPAAVNSSDAVAVYASSVKRQSEGNLMSSGFGGGAGLSPRVNPAMIGTGCQGPLGMGISGLGTSPLAVKPGASPASQLPLDSMNLGHGDGSALSPVPYGLDGGLRGRRGGVSVDKIVERRQRRMIKNRESAARSRARKQAYTVELEAEVSQLKEENKELRRKQDEMAERRKRQFMEIMSSLSQNSGNKPKLRRTQTGPW
eukprot:TRINITY_DN3594_c0_g1_i1.p1 TRINITY_DN3594_c0_g1~~TRINITY_DN3594_c0_g1_i1.p1  ORF type:complete len:439 (+),score=99.88 TRINITY_DN3594_c0_g1_i1:277-1593(+)